MDYWLGDVALILSKNRTDELDDLTEQEKVCPECGGKKWRLYENKKDEVEAAYVDFETEIADEYSVPEVEMELECVGCKRRFVNDG